MGQITEQTMGQRVDRVGVHLTHCCPRCGCKYGDEDCPVETRAMEPTYECWDCEDREESIKSYIDSFTLSELKEFSAYINQLIQDGTP